MGGRRWAWTVALSIALGCRGEREQRVDPEPLLPAPVVAVAGCEGLGEAPICLRRPTGRSLTLWLPGDWTSPELAVRLAGEPVDDASVRLDEDGLWVTIPRRPELRTGSLSLVVPGHEAFTLELAASSPEYVAARKQLRSLWNAPDEAAALIAATPVDARERHLLSCTFARTRGEAIGEAIEALAVEAELVDEVACLARVAAVGAHYTTNGSFDFEASQEHIDRIRRHASLDLTAAVQADNAAGVLAARLGLFGDALASHDRAARLSARAGLARDEATALAQRAVLLARMGRCDEAMAVARAAEGAVGDDGFVHEIRFQSAWSAILCHGQDSASAPPIATLRALEAHYTQRQDRGRQALVQLNLAVAITQSGDHERAASVLATIDREQLSGRHQLYFELLEGRIAIARGQLVLARERLDHAELLAEVILDREFRLELLDARAELALGEGRPEQAREALARAEGLADALALQIPAKDGRSSFSTTLSASRSRHLGLLVAEGQTDAAMCLVLGARARHLRTLAARNRGGSDDLDQRSAYFASLAEYHRGRAALDEQMADAWKLSRQKLRSMAAQQAREQRRLDALLTKATRLLERDPPPWSCESARFEGSSQAVLAAYPAEGGGWWFLFERGAEVSVARIQTQDPRGAGIAALAEFAARGAFEGLVDLTIIATGAVLDTDFHALEPLRGSSIRVRYGLGLGRLEAGEARLATTAAILGSGSEGLLHVQDELSVVESSLRGAGWQTGSWEPFADEQPRLLHYAGHAERSGWASALHLDGERRVTSEQLIVGQRAPALVVLGACDAGGSAATIDDGGMNVATAFVLAGASLVIAARGDVKDEVAQEFAEALYAELPDAEAVTEEALVAGLARVQSRDRRFDAWRAWTR